MPDAKLILKDGREKSLLRRHPWIFSGAVERVEGSPSPGGTVEILSHSGTFLAKGAFSPNSQIAARVWSFKQGEEIGADFFKRRVAAALSLRKDAFQGGLPEAFRLLNAESDGLPGTIADFYNGFAVCQLSTAGADKWKGSLAESLMETGLCKGVFERSDVDSREREGLRPSIGRILGEEPPELVRFQENGLSFLADLRAGHKTGFYLDQRESRGAVMGRARGAGEVLNCFSYTGGFGLAALKGGARKTVNVDASAAALELSRRNAELNGFDAASFETVEADVFQYLRRCRDAAKSFDMIILDPPKFADTKPQAEKAARGYKDINLLALKLLKPGGALFTFSCSGAVDAELFRKIVAGAALDAGREVKFLAQLSQPSDHPMAASFPEGLYLKGLICRAE